MIPQTNLYIAQSEHTEKLEFSSKDDRINYKIQSNIDPNEVKIKLKRKVKFLGCHNENPTEYTLRHGGNLTHSSQLPKIAVELPELFPESKELAANNKYEKFSNEENFSEYFSQYKCEHGNLPKQNIDIQIEKTIIEKKRSLETSFTKDFEPNESIIHFPKHIQSNSDLKSLLKMI
jgi:hypothetical protein